MSASWIQIVFIVHPFPKWDGAPKDSFQTASSPLVAPIFFSSCGDSLPATDGRIAGFKQHHSG